MGADGTDERPDVATTLNARQGHHRDRFGSKQVRIVRVWVGSARGARDRSGREARARATAEGSQFVAWQHQALLLLCNTNGLRQRIDSDARHGVRWVIEPFSG
jgi:hypothetical protein